MKKLSTFQVLLLSTGGMIGSGWLFSPFYGFQIAGAWVVVSWVIVALMTLIIGLSFAEVSTLVPMVGGISRFMGITHSKPVSFVFLALGWLSYVVYLPLEIQTCIQYLGYWFHGLVATNDNNVTLSYLGLGVALLLMIGLTWFNSRSLGNVARANTVVSLWKIIIPIAIAWGIIAAFGKADNVNSILITHKFSFESMLLAITTGGLAFAFTGFQNGLILANNVKDPKKALPYSLFSPILVGFILYCSLSLAFIFCVGSNKLVTGGTTAPLLGLIGMFSLHIVSLVLFTDAIIAPLGTSNVYTAVTSRILLSLARDFLPTSKLAKLNDKLSPAHCLWFNLIVGACFLLPFPTWQQLVDFLSSVVVFAYLAGPVNLMILRQDLPDMPRLFRVANYKLIGYLGFISCSLLIYWSGFYNLSYLLIATTIIITIYCLAVDRKSTFVKAFAANTFIFSYILTMVLVSYLRKLDIIPFPFDNICIIVIGFFACKVFVKYRSSQVAINDNLAKYAEEILGTQGESNETTCIKA